ncbi:MAG: leucine-rich repeat protein [Eubacterium sp.]|nr:leucine-rich repeat protein [Eubacterium sp.]
MKKIKKTLSVLLSAAMLLSLFAGISLTAYAEIFEYGDFNYTVLADGTVQIEAYRGDNPDLVFPEEIDGKRVTSIKTSFSTNRKIIKSIVIPDSVLQIKNGSFYWLINLESIKFSKNITELPDRVLGLCSSLESIVIPDNVTAIGESAFAGCKSLKSVAIPDSVTSMEGRIFQECTSLEEIVLPNGLKEIPYAAFDGCTNLKKVIIPDSVTEIVKDAFKDCTSLESIEIPDSVIQIDSNVFRNCSSLKSVTLPIDITNLYMDIFENCTSLTKITFPYELESLKWDAKIMQNCTNLEEIIMFSRNCEFLGDSIPSNITIYGFKNSTAETYANKNGNKFVVLGEERLDAPKANLIVNKDGTFLISWNYIEGAGSYEVYIYDNDKNTYNLKYTTDKTAIKTEVMEYVHTYRYKVRAVSAINHKFVSDFSNEVSGMNDKTMVAPVPQITANKNASFTLSWDDVFPARCYEVYLRNADGSYRLLKTVTTNSATIGGAVYGKTYTYKVRAVGKNSNLVSAYSAAVSAKNTICLVPPVPRVKANTNASLTLSWNAVAGADKYEIYLRKADGSYRLLKTVTTNSTIIGGAVYGQTYTYKVRAVGKNSNLVSAYSAAVSAKNTICLVPPIPTIRTNKNASFTLSWNAVAGAAKYEIYLRKADGSYRLLKTATTNSVTVGGAVKGKTYTYKVRAVNNNNTITSAYSSEISGVY